ncbi:MAG: SusD/RagB family nutrient-binding outer membrane lipoprotein [Bacteroidales bacterium]
MNKFKLTLLSVLLGLGSVSCVDILDDNINQDAAQEIALNDALPAIVFFGQQTVYDHAEYYIYLSQCLTGMETSSIGAYSYKSEWEFLTMNRHPQWRRHYYELGVNIENMLELAESEGSYNHALIGRTLRLLSTQLNTDCFGDMPRSQAYLSNTPSYDTQASIYEWMFQEAEDLIDLYENSEYADATSNQTITVTQDRVYTGDLSKWKGLVYAVKARLLLRNIPNVNTSSTVCNQIIAAADAAINQWRSGDLMYGAWFGNEPRYNFDGGTNEQNAPWSIAQPAVFTTFAISRANLLDTAVPSKFFMVDCLGLLNVGDETKCGAYQTAQGFANDPRASLLMEAVSGPVSATNSNSSVKVRYLDNNIGMGISYVATDYPDLFSGAYAGSTSAYNPIFTMEELYFIKAEAYYWMGDKTTACQLAKEATTYNIERHLDAWRRDNPDAADTNYPKCVTTTGTMQYETELYWNAIVKNFLNGDPNYPEDPDYKLPYSSFPKVTDKGNERWFFNESEFSLSDLMTQKYIAMYMQPEQWTDMRRYHYSNNRNNYGIGSSQEIVYQGLRRPYNLYSPYWIDGLTEAEKENTWMQRINYDPETEEQYNVAELERLGAYKNYKWLQEPMIWSQEAGVRSSLTAE